MKKTLYNLIAENERLHDCFKKVCNDWQAMTNNSNEIKAIIDIEITGFQVEYRNSTTKISFKYDFEDKYIQIDDYADTDQLRQIADIIDEIERRTLEMFEKGEE